MIMNSVDPFIRGMVKTRHARKDVNLVTFTFQGTGKLSDVETNASHKYGVDRFPRKERNFHL